MPSQVDQEKYEAVRSAVITACPEIMELSFGCKFKANDKIPFIVYVGKNTGQHCLLVPETQALLLVNKIETEILGHPIQLSHVLRAMKEKCPFGKVTEFYDGETMDEGQEQFERQSMRILREWNLTEDDLSKQSPEVIYFLWEVLCKI